MADTKDELRRQLEDLNRQITELGGERDEIFGEVGGQDQGAQDTEDVAAELTNVQETEAILAVLYAKRDRLHEQLGE